MSKNSILKLNHYTERETEKLAVMTIEQEDIGMHAHDYFELTYIMSGTAKHTLNGVEGELKAGDYFFVDYGSQHCYENCKNVTLINCMFAPELIDSSMAGCRSFEEVLRFCLIRYYKRYFGQGLSDHIMHDEDGRVLKLLEGIITEYESKEMGYMQVFRCQLIEIMILTLRKITKEEGSSKKAEVKSTAILQMIQYMEANYRDRAVLTHFCEEHYFSPQYISSRFKKENGITVLAYLQKIRIQRSCELLSGSDITVREVAYEVGYEDVQFFSQIFRKSLHMTPGDYRKISQSEFSLTTEKRQ